MKKKIILIGKKSYVAKNIHFYLKKKFNFKLINYDEFINLSNKRLLNFDYLINCSINKKYLSNKYSQYNDFDLSIVKKIANTPIKVIFLSSRKVYKIGDNIKENAKLRPQCNYSKNKLITENSLRKILGKRLLILRISNLVGVINKKKSNRKIHTTFIEMFFNFIKKNIIYNNKKVFKDFLNMDKFCEVLRKSIILNINGTYNISLGKKIFVNEIIKWLNHYNSKTIKKQKIPYNFNKDSFYLNNIKIKKKLKIDISKQELKKYCINLSKEFFLNKN